MKRQWKVYDANGKLVAVVPAASAQRAVADIQANYPEFEAPLEAK